MKMQRFLRLCLILGWLTACSKLVSSPTPAAPATAAPTVTPPATATPLAQLPASIWFHDAILYEIYPRSFYDSNGDGIGDLRGITAKLDYIQALGANTLWLTPVFSSTSPSGFEVVDFYTVAPGLGTRDDFAELVQQAHNRKMRVVMDLVMAYTSNEFPQFKGALGKPDSPYSDWYQWTNTAHTAYKSYANLRTLPLLNHKSSTLQSYLFQVAQDWLRVGVDGFRVGDASSVSHEFWKLFRRAIQQANPSALLLGEVWESDPAKLAPYFQDEFDALFDVPAYYALAGRPDRNGGGLLNGASAPNALETALAATQSYSPTAQLVRFVGAHNTNRIASIIGQNAARKRMAAVLLMTLPGTPSIYYGDEIGMPGYTGMGASGDEYRRAPMDWTKSGKGAGVATWLKDVSLVNKPDDGVSVEEQQNDKRSLWSVYQLLAAQRAGHAALRSGDFQVLASACRTCYAYARWDANDLYLVAFNFSGQTQSVGLDLTKIPRKVTGSGNDLLQGGQVSLPPDGRYTFTLDALAVRVIQWGK